MSTIGLDLSFETVDCGCCGGVYALPENYIRNKREKGGFWNCPFCQKNWGYDKDGTTVERLRRQLIRERANHDQTRADRDAAERCRRAEKAAKMRLKNRVANGVCPCCHRSFANLKRHMDSKHVDFVKTK